MKQESSKKTIQLDICITSHLTEEQAILKIIEALGEEIVITPAQKEDNSKAVDIDSLAEEILEKYHSMNEYPDYYHESQVISAMEEMYLKGKGEDQWTSVETEPEFGGEYNVLYDLQDGQEPLVSTMEFDGIKKKWYDTRGANIDCDTVLKWKPLPTPPTANDLTI
jgi:hypothetical protein